MLDNIDRNKNPFNVPENYFETLSDRIMDRLTQENKLEVKKVSLWKKSMPWFSAAAAVLILVLALGLMNSDAATDDSVKYAANLEGRTEIWSDADNYTDEDYYIFLEDESVGYMYADIVLNDIN